MTTVIKPLSTEMSLTTANTVANGTAIRLVNNQASTTLITVVALASNAYPGQTNTTSTFTMLANTECVVKKMPQDTVAAAQAVLAVSVGFFN